MPDGRQDGIPGNTMPLTAYYWRRMHEISNRCTKLTSNNNVPVLASVLGTRTCWREASVTPEVDRCAFGFCSWSARAATSTDHWRTYWYWYGSTELGTRDFCPVASSEERLSAVTAPSGGGILATVWRRHAAARRLWNSLLMRTSQVSSSQHPSSRSLLGSVHHIRTTALVLSSVLHAYLPGTISTISPSSPTQLPQVRSNTIQIYLQ